MLFRRYSVLTFNAGVCYANMLQADKNLDIFLGHLSDQFGEGGKVWEEVSSSLPRSSNDNAACIDECRTVITMSALGPRSSWKRTTSQLEGSFPAVDKAFTIQRSTASPK